MPASMRVWPRVQQSRVVVLVKAQVLALIKSQRVYFLLTIVVACSVVLVAAKKRCLMDMRPRVDESRTVHERDWYHSASKPRERVLVPFETF